MGACESMEQLPAGKPVLYYGPIAARAEIARMTAKLGGLEMESVLTDGSNLDMKSFGSPGSIPVFQHGDLKLSQSNAIITYIVQITPKFKGLTAAHKARDRQFNGIMDDIMDGAMPKWFGNAPDKHENAKKVLEKWYPMLEELAPTAGFVNGLPFPTGADFVVVVLAKGTTPFVALNKIAGIDPWEKCPKLKALLERTMAVAEVKDYVANSKTMNGNPFNLPV